MVDQCKLNLSSGCAEMPGWPVDIEQQGQAVQFVPQTVQSNGIDTANTTSFSDSTPASTPSSPPSRPVQPALFRTIQDVGPKALVSFSDGQIVELEGHDGIVLDDPAKQGKAWGLFIANIARNAGKLAVTILLSGPLDQVRYSKLAQAMQGLAFYEKQFLERSAFFQTLPPAQQEYTLSAIRYRITHKDVPPEFVAMLKDHYRAQFGTAEAFLEGTADHLNRYVVYGVCIFMVLMIILMMLNPALTVGMATSQVMGFFSTRTVLAGMLAYAGVSLGVNTWLGMRSGTRQIEWGLQAHDMFAVALGAQRYEAYRANAFQEGIAQGLFLGTGAVISRSLRPPREAPFNAKGLYEAPPARFAPASSPQASVKPGLANSEAFPAKPVVPKKPSTPDIEALLSAEHNLAPKPSLDVQVWRILDDPHPTTPASTVQATPSSPTVHQPIPQRAPASAPTRRLPLVAERIPTALDLRAQAILDSARATPGSGRIPVLHLTPLPPAEAATLASAQPYLVTPEPWRVVNPWTVRWDMPLPPDFFVPPPRDYVSLPAPMQMSAEDDPRDEHRQIPSFPVTRMVVDDTGSGIFDPSRARRIIREAEDNAREGLTGKAKNLLQEVLTNDPSTRDKIVNLAIKYLRGNPWFALIVAEILGLCDVDDAHVALGNHYYKEKEFDQAWFFYLEARYVRGLVLVAGHMYETPEKAGIYFNEAMIIDPVEARPLILIEAQGLLRKFQSVESIKMLQTVEMAFKVINDTDGLTAVGDQYRERGNYDDANRVYRRARSAAGLASLGEIYAMDCRNEGNYAKAKEYFNAAIAMGQSAIVGIRIRRAAEHLLEEDWVNEARELFILIDDLSGIARANQQAIGYPYRQAMHDGTRWTLAQKIEAGRAAYDIVEEAPSGFSGSVAIERFNNLVREIGDWAFKKALAFIKKVPWLRVGTIMYEGDWQDEKRKIRRVFLEAVINVFDFLTGDNATMFLNHLCSALADHTFDRYIYQKNEEISKALAVLAQTKLVSGHGWSIPMMIYWHQVMARLYTKYSDDKSAILELGQANALSPPTYEE